MRRRPSPVKDPCLRNSAKRYETCNVNSQYTLNACLSLLIGQADVYLAEGYDLLVKEDYARCVYFLCACDSN